MRTGACSSKHFLIVCQFNLPRFDHGLTDGSAVSRGGAHVTIMHAQQMMALISRGSSVSSFYLAIGEMAVGGWSFSLVWKRRETPHRAASGECWSCARSKFSRRPESSVDYVLQLYGSGCTWILSYCYNLNVKPHLLSRSPRLTPLEIRQINP